MLKISRLLKASIGVLAVICGLHAIAAANPWRIVALPTVSALASLPDTVGLVTPSIYVHGYSAANDGGQGSWIYDTTSKLAPDGGTVIQPPNKPAAGRWLRQIDGPFRPEWFGASCAPSADSSNAFARAIAAAQAASAGIVDATHCAFYKANIVITGAIGLKIIFGNVGYAGNPDQSGIYPAAASRPAITIGDGIHRTSDVTLQGFALHGKNTAEKGLLINGASFVRIRDCSLRGFTQYQLRATSSASQPSYNNFVDHCDLANAPIASSFGMLLEYGASYDTPFFITNSTLNSSPGSAFLIKLSGHATRGAQAGSPVLFMSQDWVQAANGTGIEFADPFGRIFADNLAIDSARSDDSLITFADDTYVQNHITGTFTCDCRIAMPAGNTQPVSGQNFLPQQSRLQNPAINGALYLCDNAARFHDQYGACSEVSLANRKGVAELVSTAGGILVQPADGTAVTFAGSKAGGQVGLALIPSSVSSLPPPSAHRNEIRAVTDARTPQLGAPATAGGQASILVRSNGTNWIVQ